MSPDATVYGIDCNGRLYALDGATGKEKWTRDTKEKYSDPVIGADGLLYAGTVSKKVIAFDSKTGEQAWEYSTANDNGSSQTPDIPFMGPDGIQGPLEQLLAEPEGEAPEVIETERSIEIDGFRLYKKEE